MALRDQPYIPLYVQDIMTDEKLNECCAATHGIYIKGIMCLMHKSEQYGKILLKQKDKQTDKQILNFAAKLAKHLPYTPVEIELALNELIREEVLQIEDDFLVQKRMVKDNALSIKRSDAGRKGGNITFAQANNEANTKANVQANSEYEIENEYDNEVIISSSLEIAKIEKLKKAKPEGENELTEYFDKLGFKIEADKFYDFYESKGWMIGKSKMKDWRAAARNWVRNSKPNTEMSKANKTVLAAKEGFEKYEIKV